MYYGDASDDYYWGDEGYDEAASGDFAASWPIEQPVQCTNGPTCKFFALGVCRFYHPETEEDGGEEAWDGELAEDWQAWEEPVSQEPAVYRMVVPPSSGTAAPKQPSTAAAPGHRWNVLVNSGGSSTKGTEAAPTRSVSRSPRRRKPTTTGGETRAPPPSDSSSAAPVATSPPTAAPAAVPARASASASATAAATAVPVIADTARRRHHRSHHRAAVLREAPQYMLQERFEPLEPPPGVF